MIEWTTEQKELAKAIKAWASPINAEPPAQGALEIFLERWKILNQMGLFKIPIKAEYGGLNHDILTTMYALEALGNICMDEGLSFGACSHIVSTLVPIQRFGSEQQKQTYLNALSSGSKIGAHAITEPESGSDAWNMKTNAVKRGDSFILSGNKTFISNGPVADTFVVYAKTDESKGALGGFTAFIVDREQSGFTVGQPIEKMGLNTSTVCDLYFEDVSLSENQVLGKVGNGFPIFNYVMNWEILCTFIVNVGEMERLMKRCIDYSKQRKQYGEPISKFQAISHKIADMKIRLETARTMLYSAAQKFQSGKSITVELAIAKIVTSEGFVQSALDGIQIFGGYGYMNDTGIEKYLRNSVGSKIYSGTSEIQRNTIASMLGL